MFIYFQPARHTKLEKADILEMTVKHLQTVQRSQLALAVQTDPNVLHKFKAGFADCTDEVSRYITQMDGVDTVVKQRLIGHLGNCVGGLQQLGPYSNYASSYPQAAPAFAAALSQPQHAMPLPQDLNNNGGRIQMGGVQLIPSRLPTGELALVMPNSSNLPYFPSASFQSGLSAPLEHPIPTAPRISAFNSVQKPIAKHLTANSPPLSPASSVSSGEDSMPPSDYQSMATTPPLQSQQNMMNLFPTPPSGGSVQLVLHTGKVTVQQPQISSTTEHTRIKPLSVITNTATNTVTAPKKRPYPADHLEDNGNSGLLQLTTDEPSAKMFKSNTNTSANGVNARLNNNNNGADDVHGDMWRPW